MKQIVKIELKNIDSFKDHPFKVQRDDSFNELKEMLYRKKFGLSKEKIAEKVEERIPFSVMHSFFLTKKGVVCKNISFLFYFFF